MQDSKIIPPWKSWLTIGRLIPLLTILAAAIVGILSLLGHFQVTMAEGVIIALLTLLAIDALVERLSLLEKIDARLERFPETEQLKDRSKIIRMEDLATGATEICAAGISLISIIPPYVDLYIQKLREGSNLRFLLLDPASTAIKVWDQQQLAATTKSDIQTSLRVLNKLMQLKDAKGKCEARLTNTHLSYSLLIVDGKKEGGKLRVEIFVYKKNLHDRPHLHLTKRDNYKWFQFFCDQFESLWQDSTSRQPI